MNKPIISIIVPIYNVEQFIHCCVDSILAQTFTDWELLLIDDGTLDRSGEICDEYAKKDNRIRVFHKKNGGVSSARNLGLDNAQGEWVTFIDADDYILPDFIKGLYRPIEEGESVDFVHGGCCNVKNGEIVNVNQSYDNYIGDNSGYVFRMFRGLTVSKLFSLENVNHSVDGRPLRFDEKMKIAEDMAFTMDYLLSVKRYAFVEEKGYCYRIDNICSATRSKRKVKYETELHSFRHLYKSTISYINRYNIGIEDCKLRLQQRGNQMAETIFSLYYGNCRKKDRLLHLQNDFSKIEQAMLCYANLSPIKKYLISFYINHQYKLFDILTSLSLKLILCLR